MFIIKFTMYRRPDQKTNLNRSSIYLRLISRKNKNKSIQKIFPFKNFPFLPRHKNTLFPINILYKRREYFPLKPTPKTFYIRYSMEQLQTDNSKTRAT